MIHHARGIWSAALIGLLLAVSACGQTGALVLPAEPLSPEAEAEAEAEAEKAAKPLYEPSQPPAHIKPGDEDLKARQNPSAPPEPIPGTDPR